MSKKSLQLISKGKRSLEAARVLLERGDFDFSVSRSYYSMFYGAQALLLTKNVAPSKHSHLLSEFHQHFVKPEIVPKLLHQYLHQAFELRQQGDYWSDSKIDEKTAEDLLNNAGKFISFLEDYLIV